SNKDLPCSTIAVAAGVPLMPAVQLALMLPEMARLDLTDDEREVLARTLRQLIDGDRFPLSPASASCGRSWRSWSRRQRPSSRSQPRSRRPSPATHDGGGAEGCAYRKAAMTIGTTRVSTTTMTTA